MQAKKVNKVPYIVPNGETHQLKLYEEWHTFTLERAGALNGTEIDIQPKTLNSGAQYLLFQKPYIYEQMVYCAYPDKELVFKKKLSDQIIDLMKFFTGRTFLFKKDLTCNDDWNKLIWDLIRISGVSTYNRRSIRRAGESRRVIYGDGSLFYELNENLYIREDSFGDSFGEGAVSCLMIYAKEIKEGNW